MTIPCSQVDVRFDSEGHPLRGLLYLPAGPGPHPAVLMLHGLPGNERNGDLTHALRSQGYAVLCFSWRGSWATPGRFSLGNAVADARAGLAFLRGEAGPRGDVDPRRILLLGHSFGGGVALLASAAEPAPYPVITLAGWHAGEAAGYWQGRPDERSQFDSFVEDCMLAAGGPVDGDAAAFLSDVENSSTLRAALACAGRPFPILSVVGSRDAMDLHMHVALKGACMANGWPFDEHVLDDDHVFSNCRADLIRICVQRAASTLSGPLRFQAAAEPRAAT